MISLEEIGAACFALGIVDTSFLASVALTFLATLGLTSALAFESTFFSVFLSDLAIVRQKTVLEVEPDLQNFGLQKYSLRQRISLANECPSHGVRILNSAAMADLEGNFDVIIFGTGLVESIAAA
jgi:hypothetical protein